MKVKLLRVFAISMSMFFATTAIAEIKVGFIGSLSSDTGLSTLRGAEIAIDELNAKGGVLGQQITLVTADTRQDVTEGVKAYEYLAETEEVDFIRPNLARYANSTWEINMDIEVESFVSQGGSIKELIQFQRIAFMPNRYISPRSLVSSQVGS